MKKNLILILSVITIVGCKTEKSKLTDGITNDPKHGGFEVNTTI